MEILEYITEFED